jgi:hypothetical protein
MLRNAIIVISLLCLASVPTGQAFPTSILQLDYLAKAPVLATAVVESVDYLDGKADPTRHTVQALAVLRVLRAFPNAAVGSGDAVHLRYETLPPGSLGESGPAVLVLQPEEILIFPLKMNSDPNAIEWHLYVDQGTSLVIPAIRIEQSFSSPAVTGHDFVLREIANAMATGPREEVFRESNYFFLQDTKAYASELVQLVKSKIGNDSNRWALIAASLISSTGVPRVTIADLRSGEFATKDMRGPAFLIRAALLEIGDAEEANHKLVHQLLNLSDLNEWGAGMTLREFAGDPYLVRELREMLAVRRPGSLSVARDMLRAGQTELLADATAVAHEYADNPETRLSEIGAACQVLRDFGSDDQFRQFLGLMRKYEYSDTHHFDDLWRNSIWSDNVRERAVLDILLADHRSYANGQSYIQIAESELARLQALKPSAK